MINVKDAPYYATGDGTTDDRAAIQSAIDAATAGVGGRRVYLPKGTYGVANELIVKHEVYLIGDGPTNTIIKALAGFSFPNQDTAILHQQTSNGTNVQISTHTPMGRIYLRDLQVTGNNVSGSNGILASCQQQCSWDNVRIDNCAGTYGLGLGDGQQLLIRNMELIGNNRGIKLSGHSFVYFDCLNIEFSITEDILIQKGASNIIPYSLAFTNVHLEANASVPTSIHVDEVEGVTFTNIFLTMDNVGTMFRFDDQSANETRGAVYTIRNARVLGTPTNVTMLDDQSRSISLNAFSNCRSHLPFYVSPNENVASAPWALENGLVLGEVAGLRRV